MSGLIAGSDVNLLERPSLEEYFIQTGYYDLLPLAWQLANNLGYGQKEMIEAVCCDRQVIMNKFR